MGQLVFCRKRDACRPYSVGALRRRQRQVTTFATETHDESLEQPTSLVQLFPLRAQPRPLFQMLLRKPAKVFEIPIITERVIVPRVVIPQTTPRISDGARDRRKTYFTPTMVRSIAVISVSIMRSCHLKSPVRNASRLLELYEMMNATYLSNSLHVHRNARLAKHDRHLAELFVRLARDIPDLELVITFRRRSAKVQCAGDEHALYEGSVPGRTSICVCLLERVLGR